jgi:protein involved in polysaccharide export with SLBB domain
MKLLALCVLSVVACLGQMDYWLHPKENILIHAPQNKDLNDRIFKIQPDGFVNLPTLGRVRASGVTLRTFEKRLANRLGHDSDQASQVKVSAVSFREETGK